MHRSPMVYNVVLCHLPVSKFTATEIRIGLLFPQYYIKLGFYNVFVIFKVCHKCVRNAETGTSNCNIFAG